MYWLTGILGLGFALAPFVIGYLDNSVAVWTSIILGGAVMTVSFLEARADDRGRWEYWVATMVGIGAIAAPFLFGFGSYTRAMSTSVIVGLLLAVIAGYKLYSDQPRYG